MTSKKLLWILSAAVLASGALAGCGNKNNSTESTTEESSTTSETESSTSSTEDASSHPTAWEHNREYLSWLSENENVNPELSSSSDPAEMENGFIRSSKYYVGNRNGINLLPYMTNTDEEEIVVFDTINPADFETKLYKVGAGETLTEVKLENVLDSVTDATTKGIINFKDDITGDYRLVYQGATELYRTYFDPLAYNMTVVDAYNVYEANDLYVLDNSSTYRPTSGILNKGQWKAELGLEGVVYDAVALHADVTFEKENIYPKQIWTDGEVVGVSQELREKVVGSLKDWSYIIERIVTPEDEGKELAIYGNFHSIELGESFPRTTVDGSHEKSFDQGDTPISCHSKLFNILNVDQALAPEKFNAKFMDLLGVGNHGVNTEETADACGLIIANSEVDTFITNCVLEAWYINFMKAGNSDKNLIEPDINVIDSRLRNSFQNMIFNYGPGDINIEHSELVKCGGPIIFNQATPADYSQTADGSFFSADVFVDDSSFLENWVSGQEGWFQAYQGSQALVGNIVQIDALFKGQIQSTYTKVIDDQTKINLLIVNMPLGESADISTVVGGLPVSVNIGGTELVNTYAHRQEFHSALAGLDMTNPATLAPVIAALDGNDYAHNMMLNNVRDTVLFKTANGTASTFAMVDQDDKHTFLENPVYKYGTNLGLTGEQLSAFGVSQLTDNGFNASANGYVAAYLGGVPQNNYDGSGMPSPSTYRGPCGFSIILGGFGLAQ